MKGSTQTVTAKSKSPWLLRQQVCRILQVGQKHPWCKHPSTCSQSDPLHILSRAMTDCWAAEVWWQVSIDRYAAPLRCRPAWKKAHILQKHAMQLCCRLRPRPWHCFRHGSWHARRRRTGTGLRWYSHSIVQAEDRSVGPLRSFRTDHASPAFQHLPT